MGVLHLNTFLVEDISLIEDTLVGGVGEDKAVAVEVQLTSFISTLVCAIFDVKCLDSEHLICSSHGDVRFLDENIASRTLQSSS